MIILLYLLTKYYWQPAHIVFYPVAIIVTFLHEIGHALMAILTGGRVDAIEVSAETGGLAATAGGIRCLVLIGGYVGSAILGNIFIAAGVIGNKFSKILSVLLSLGLAVVAFLWINDLTTTLILLATSVLFLFFAFKYNSVNTAILSVIGVLALAYIVEDYRVGPGSDIEKFVLETGWLNKTAWMYIWLIFVVLITIVNGYFIYRYLKKETKQ